MRDFVDRAAHYGYWSHRVRDDYFRFCRSRFISNYTWSIYGEVSHDIDVPASFRGLNVYSFVFDCLQGY